MIVYYTILLSFLVFENFHIKTCWGQVEIVVINYT